MDILPHLLHDDGSKKFSKTHNINWKTLYGVKETDIVPGGVAELAHLQQQKGLAYIAP